MKTHFKGLIEIAFLLGAFIIVPYLHDQSVTNCHAINANRREGNNRADILRDLLTTAATARDDSAANDTDPVQKKIDQKAAKHYRYLASQVHNLSEENC